MSDDLQAQGHAERQEAHRHIFEHLPPAGGNQYWQVIETSGKDMSFPLEVLARCVRERYLAGYRADAERVFAVLMWRIQGYVRTAARRVAHFAHATNSEELARDIAQETYVAIWVALVGEKEPFYLTGFKSAMIFAEKHAAEKIMIEAGEWTHHGVEKGTRVPADKLDSVDETKTNNDGQPTTIELEDRKAERAFDVAELREDVRALLSKCGTEDLQLLFALYWQGETQDEIAKRLGITDRTVRNRLNRVLESLRKRMLDGEEDSGGTR